MVKNLIRKPLYHCIRLYFKFRHLWLVWFFILNNKARRLYKKNNSGLNQAQKRIINDLKRNGIAVTHLDELFPGRNLLPKLQEYMKKLSQSAEIKTPKKFLKYMFNDKPLLDFENPFVRVSVNETVLGIVNAYMQMYSNFYYFTLNKTMPVNKGLKAEASQRWHRDPEDKRMCKLFVYLSDVDEDSGPFMYIPKSNYGNEYGKLFPQQPPKGIYPPYGEVEKKLPHDAVKILTGKAGTVVFGDTSGLHKGGYATGRERIMFTAGYCSRASRSILRYKYPKMFKEKLDSLTPAQKFAVTFPSKKVTLYALSVYKRLKRSFKFQRQQENI